MSAPVPGPLTARLKAMMDKRPAWYRDILADLAVTLRATAATRVLGPAAPMPDFVLPNAAGELVASADLRGRGPLVVCFVRGGWCPFCNATLEEIDAALPAIGAAGGSVVVLTPDMLGHAQATRRELGLRVELLIDADCAVGLQFGTVYRVPDIYRAAVASFGIDLVRRHGHGPGLLPMPATFVCGPDGVLILAQPSPDITERTEPSGLAALVRRMATRDAGT